MKNKLILVIIALFSLAVVFFYLLPHRVTKIELSDQVLLQIPECKYLKERFVGKEEFTDSEMAEMNVLHYSCTQEQIKLINSKSLESKDITKTIEYHQK